LKFRVFFFSFYRGTEGLRNGDNNFYVFSLFSHDVR